mgnify:CR=1 FL=1
MAEISRVALFGKLNSLCYRAVESSTVFCKLRGNPYVEMVHWLHQILQLQDSDLHRIISHFDIEPAALARDLTLTSEALAPLITPEKLPAPTLKVVAPSPTSPAPCSEATATVLPEKEAVPPAVKASPKKAMGLRILPPARMSTATTLAWVRTATTMPSARKAAHCLPCRCGSSWAITAPTGRSARAITSAS